MPTGDVSENVSAVARAAISFSGGLATTHYYIDGATVHALVTALAPVVAIIWSIYSRQPRHDGPERRRRPY